MHIDPGFVLVLVAAAAAAGWFDAVVGGGGLVQLPALMLACPGLPLPALIGTDKLASTIGTTSSAIRFARRTEPELRLVVPTGLCAVVASGLGLHATGLVPRSALGPFVILALITVLLVVVRYRDLGLRPRPHVRTPRRRRYAVVMTGALLPFYNGMVGPGTGTMMVVALTALLGMDFVAGSAASKVVNVGANVGALVVAAATSQVLWLVGGAMAVANVAGAQLGTRLALARGARFVRAVLVVVVAVLILDLAVQEVMA